MLFLLFPPQEAAEKVSFRVVIVNEEMPPVFSPFSWKRFQHLMEFL